MPGGKNHLCPGCGKSFLTKTRLRLQAAYDILLSSKAKAQSVDSTDCGQSICENGKNEKTRLQGF